MLLVLGLATLVAAEDEPKNDEPKIYNCTDATGALLFQDEPCEVTKARPAPKAVPAPAVAPKARPASRAIASVPASHPPTMYRFAPGSEKPPVPKLTNVPWEPTWRAFVDALSQGDRPAALRCLTSQALTDLGPRIQAADAEALKGMVAPFDRVVVEGDVGPYWSIRVLRAGARPKWVFFERTPRGEWKIAAI